MEPRWAHRTALPLVAAGAEGVAEWGYALLEVALASDPSSASAKAWR
jgi:hypothetical protein